MSSRNSPSPPAQETIIPVYLEQAEIPETMEYQLAGIQRVEYFVENEDCF